MGSTRGPDRFKVPVTRWSVMPKAVHPLQQAQIAESVSIIEEAAPLTRRYQRAIQVRESRVPMAKVRKEAAKGGVSKPERQHKRERAVEPAKQSGTTGRKQRHERELTEYRQQYQADPGEWPWTVEMRENLNLRRYRENHNRPILERKETARALALHRQHEIGLAAYAKKYDSDRYRDTIWPIQSVDRTNLKLVGMIEDHNRKLTEAAEWKRRQTAFMNRPVKTYTAADWEAEKARNRKARTQKYQHEALQKRAHIRRTIAHANELQRNYYVVGKVKPIPGKVD